MPGTAPGVAPAVLTYGAKAGTSLTFCHWVMPAENTSVSASMLPFCRLVMISCWLTGPTWWPPMAMYHWESDQEDFLVLAGEAVLVVEGEERPLRQWDFVHCPPLTKHVLVGAGDRPCVVLAVGARARQGGPD